MTNLIENYKTIGQVDENTYNETSQPQITSRLLEGSSDHGYYMEYVGYGTVEFNGEKINVKAVYLFDDDVKNVEECDFYWDVTRFEIED
jgi:nitrous oxidase accessory protein NosD